MKLKGTPLKLALVALGIAAIVTVVIVASGKRGSGNVNHAAPLTTAPSFTVPTDWKMFDGAKSGFSFQTPPDAVVAADPKSPSTVTVKIGGSTFTFVMNSQVRTRVSSPQCYTERARRAINGVIWSVNDLQCGTGGNSTTVYSLTSGTNILETYYPGSNNSETLEQILATLHLGA